MEPTIESRLAAIEQELATAKQGAKWWKRIGLAGVCAVAMVGAVATQTVADVEAQQSIYNANRFNIFDNSGANRGTLVALPDGSAGIGLATITGRYVIAQSVALTGEPHYLLLDLTGKVRMDITADLLGAPSVQMLDSNGRNRLDLRLDTNGNPSIKLGDVTGRVIWQAP